MESANRNDEHVQPADGEQIMSESAYETEQGGHGEYVEEKGDVFEAQRLKGSGSEPLRYIGEDIGEDSDEEEGLPRTEVLTREQLKFVSKSSEFISLLKESNFKYTRVMKMVAYHEELKRLQVELVKMQRWVQDNNKRVAILFEGRDAAGKGGAIRRFVEHLNPRAMRIVALPKPTEDQKGQWYFQRYVRQLPNQGEVVFFDRSWYNRAVVEPVNGFCTKLQYEQFMRQVPEFEHMLFEDGITIVKFWFSISKEEQLSRFNARRQNPLKQWKLSPIDQRAQELWDNYTKYKDIMFSRTHTSFSPWVLVKANNKLRARLESIRHVLSCLDYDGKTEADISLQPDPNIISRFHRSHLSID